MSLYKQMKFKMKMSYERWMLNLKMGRLLHLAIYQTIVERQRLAHYDLNQFLTAKHND